jgi:hypothetical protein
LRAGWLGKGEGGRGTVVDRSGEMAIVVNSTR